MPPIASNLEVQCTLKRPIVRRLFQQKVLDGLRVVMVQSGTSCARTLTLPLAANPKSLARRSPRNVETPRLPNSSLELREAAKVELP